MTEYTIAFSFSVSVKGSYSTVVNFSLSSDAVPEGQEPVAYLRERLNAEIKRVTKDKEFDTSL